MDYGACMNYLQRTAWFFHGVLFALTVVGFIEVPSNSFLLLFPGILVYMYWSLTALFGIMDLLNFIEKYSEIWNEKQDIFKESK